MSLPTFPANVLKYNICNGFLHLQKYITTQCLHYFTQQSSFSIARDKCKIPYTTHSNVTQYNYRDTTSSVEKILTCYAYVITSLYNMTVSAVLPIGVIMVK